MHNAELSVGDGALDVPKVESGKWKVESGVKVTPVPVIATPVRRLVWQSVFLFLWGRRRNVNFPRWGAVFLDSFRGIDV